MASGFLLNLPKFSAVDDNGDPLAGGKVYTYAQGTSTPKATYSDKNCTTPNANPIILDSRGEATVYLGGYYKIILKDSADATIWTMDNIVGIGYTALTGVTLADYGGDLAAAVTGIGSTETTLYVDTDCTVSGNLVIPANIALDIKRGGAINPNAGVTVTINGAVIAGAYAIFGGSGTVTCNVLPKLKAWWGSGTITGIIATCDVGTMGLFGQNTAPTGWTIDVNHTDAVLALKGGSNAYNANGGTSAGTWTVANNVGFVADSHVLSTTEIPGHTHSVTITVTGTGGSRYASGVMQGQDSGGYLSNNPFDTGSTGGGSGHTHSVSSGGSAVTWRPAASLCIRATKD
jgi:hypothetical protein